MRETRQKIQYKIAEGSSNTSSFAGLAPIVEFYHRSGLPDVIDKSIGIRTTRGRKDHDHVLSLVLLQLAGASAVDHLPFLKEKLSFERLGVDIPSPTACRAWLKEFHNPNEDIKRGMGKAFIPESNRHLDGFGKVFTHLFSVISAMDPRASITLDQDATFIETESKGALWNYQGNRSYEAFSTYCPEHDLVLASKYSDGNVPPGYMQFEEFKEVLKGLPEEVTQVSLRSDSAGYQTDLLRYCSEGRDSRFGFIPFTISSPVRKEFKQAVKAVAEREWKPLMRRDSDGSLIPTGQEWAEVVYVPDNLSRKKHGPDYRFLAVREKYCGPLDEIKDNFEKNSENETLSAPGRINNEAGGYQLYIPQVIEAIEKENPDLRRLHLTGMGTDIYKITAVATNIEDGTDGERYGLKTGETMDGGKIICWHRQRCGKSEELHHILKDNLAGGHIPSANFGANAAWWNISVLALNLHNILKNQILPKGFSQSRPKTLRFMLYTMAGRIVSHGRRIMIKVWRNDRGCELFRHAMERIARMPAFGT